MLGGCCMTKIPYGGDAFYSSYRATLSDILDTNTQGTKISVHGDISGMSLFITDCSRSSVESIVNLRSNR